MNITSFLVYCFIITVTPGPTNIDILSTVNTQGTKKALNYTYGATLSFGLLLTISAILNTMLIALLPKILIVMQVFGSMYMLYLMYKIYKIDVSEQTEHKKQAFKSGFILQFLNPKVVTFTMTVLPSFILPYYTGIAALTASVLTITIIGFISFIIWVSVGTIFRSFLQRYKKIVNAMMMLFLLYAALMIWL